VKRITLLLFFLFSLLICFGQNEDGIYAEINTSKGKIVVQLEYERAPMTVSNFIGLSEGKIENSFKKVGAQYFDGLTFHRVVDNGIVQGGCPKGDGTGNPGYKFKDEFHRDLKHDNAGILSMANSGKNTNGSQWFITHRAIPKLDGVHTVFGHVVEGQETVNAIQKGDRIESVKIIRKGEKSNNFNINEAFPVKMRKKTK